MNSLKMIKAALETLEDQMAVINAETDAAYNKAVASNTQEDLMFALEMQEKQSTAIDTIGKEIMKYRRQISYLESMMAGGASAMEK